jgi:hypothetical protein
MKVSQRSWKGKRKKGRGKGKREREEGKGREKGKREREERKGREKGKREREERKGREKGKTYLYESCQGKKRTEDDCLLLIAERAQSSAVIRDRSTRLRDGSLRGLLRGRRLVAVFEHTVFNVHLMFDEAEGGALFAIHQSEKCARAKPRRG